MPATAINTIPVIAMASGTSANNNSSQTAAKARYEKSNVATTADGPLWYATDAPTLPMMMAVASVGGDQVAELSGRVDELADWQSGRKRILAVQIATGSEGIDLTRARYAVYLSTGFNLGTYLQSEKRVHRPGQKKPVTYYHIVSRDTVDEKVRGALRARHSVIGSILSMISNPEAQTEP